MALCKKQEGDGIQPIVVGEVLHHLDWLSMLYSNQV